MRPNYCWFQAVRSAVRLAAGMLLFALLMQQARATVYYASPSGTGNGSSRAMAGPLQTLISGAHSGDQVWAKYGI